MKLALSKVQRAMRILLIVAITISGLFFIAFGCGEDKGRGCSSGEIGSIKLAWDPSSDPDLAGYKVYYGTSSGKYGPGIAVGNVTTYELSGLIKGKTYYIVVTAHDKSGRESRFSSEISGVAK